MNYFQMILLNKILNNRSNNIYKNEIQITFNYLNKKMITNK